MKREMSETIEEKTIKQIFIQQLGVEPVSIQRMKTGICNEVFEVETNDGNNFIIRLNKNPRPLEGSDKYIPLFKSKGIKVPEIITSDYSLKALPFAYQVLSKIEGEDLGDVISDLDNEQLEKIAQEISHIFDKLKDIPTDGSFGWVDASGHGQFSSWIEVMQSSINTAIERGKGTGVIDEHIEEILRSVFANIKDYFSKVESQFYYDDICSKNVMIEDGQFSGLVDLDGVGYGDPLEAIGRIKASWFGTDYGDIYTKTIEKEQHLSKEDQLMVTTYALIHRISWLCENGIQFNQNTSSSINWEKARKDKEVILALYAEYQNSLARIQQD